MSTRKRSLGVWILGGLLCALLITWGIEVGDGQGSIVRAQQDNWTTEAARKQGIRLLETRDPKGPAAYPVAPGDVLFFTNSGTTGGARNQINSVVVINAKTKKPIAVSEIEPAWAEKFISHGIGVSPDAKYVYLPGQAPTGSKNPSSVLVLDARSLKIYQIIADGGERPHHIKVYEDWMGRKRVLFEDFNWNDGSPNGKGFFVVDSYDNNKVLAGMTPGELRGNPYGAYTAPDGKYLYLTVEAPTRQIRGELQGWMAKIDMQTWEVVQRIPLLADPIWATLTQDGKYVWVTHAAGNKISKIERATAPGQMDKVVAEVPVGPGPYGLSLNYDDKEVWTADKGEGTPAAKRKTTITVVDAVANQPKRTIETGCRTNDHVILSPDGLEMWATCNGSQEVVVVDTKTYEVKARVPMPNQGDSHGGTFVSYTQGPGGIVGEVVADQNGLHGSARDARRNGVPWAPAGSR